MPLGSNECHNCEYDENPLGGVCCPSDVECSISISNSGDDSCVSYDCGSAISDVSDGCSYPPPWLCMRGGGATNSTEGGPKQGSSSYKGKANTTSNGTASSNRLGGGGSSTRQTDSATTTSQNPTPPVDRSRPTLTIFTELEDDGPLTDVHSRDAKEVSEHHAVSTADSQALNATMTSLHQLPQMPSDASPVGPYCRLSATPVVPIQPFNEAATRRRVAADIERRFGPDGCGESEAAAAAAANGNVNNNSISAVGDSSSVAAAVPVTDCVQQALSVVQPPPRELSKAEQKELAKQRKAEEKEAARRRKAIETLAKKKQTIAKAPAAPTLTREQIIRIGATRMLQRLNELSLVVHRVKNDGNCQFRAIAQQLLGSEDYHDIIRSHIVSYMQRMRGTHFDHYFGSKEEADTYFQRLAKNGTWGDELTLRGASDSLCINIHVLSSAEKNCYITYRPSEDAPPAPTFLVDVAKIRERRRMEREMRRQWPNGNYSFPMPDRTRSADSLYNAMPDTGAEASALPSARSVPMMGDIGPESDDESELDANAIQRALQRKLAGSRITGYSPYFTPDGNYFSPGARPHSTSPSFDASSSSKAVSGGRNENAKTMPAGGGGASRGAQSIPAPPTELPAPLLIPRNSGGLGSGGVSADNTPIKPGRSSTSNAAGTRRTPATTLPSSCASEGDAHIYMADVVDNCERNGCHRMPHLSKFKAAGAQSQTAGNESVVLASKTAALKLPPARLLQPVTDSRHVDANRTVPPSSFPVFPTVEGGSVPLLASHRATDLAASSRSLKQSFSSFCPGSFSYAPYSAGDSAADAHGSFATSADVLDDDAEVCCFVMEPRVEPIDVFLSYLYPVHYNALTVHVDAERCSPTSRQDGASSGRQPQNGENESFISAPFLRLTD